MSSKGEYTILFVCTGNTCRSPMAEYAMRSLLEKERPGQSEVFSAGIAAAAGFPATMYAIEAAKMWDLDLSAHHSQMLSADQIDRADLIFAMSPEHHHAAVHLSRKAKSRTYLLKNFPDNSPQGEDIEDPIGQSLENYNETFLEIGECLGEHLKEIVRRIDEKHDA